MKDLPRRLTLYGVPLALGVLEMWHPTFDSRDFANLLPLANQWLAVHLLQIPLFGLLGYVLVLLVRGLDGWVVWGVRLAAGTFAVFYVALDAVAGVATGILARYAVGLPPGEQAGIVAAMGAIFHSPIAGGGISVIGLLGSAAWLAGAWGAAIALYVIGAPRLTVLLLALSGLTLFTGHFPPYGPVAMTCLFLAAAWLDLAPVFVRKPAAV